MKGITLSVLAVVAGAPILGLARGERTYPTEWTPEYKAELVESMLGPWRDRFTQEDGDEMLSCFTAKISTALPGGPRQMVELVQRDPRALSEIGMRVGPECLAALRGRITSSPTWGKSADTLYTRGCLNEGFSRDACACVLIEMKKHFAGPAEFERINAGEYDSMAEPDRFKMKKVANCLSDGPDDPGPALVDACSSGNRRDWCVCVVAEAKLRFASPAEFFQWPDNDSTRAVISRCGMPRGKKFAPMHVK